MKEAQQFISILFLSRDYAHKAHFNTDSYSQHVALNEFYDAIIDLADDFAEAWMGRNQQKIGDIPTLMTKNGQPLEVLKKHLEMVQSARDFVKDDSVLSNIADEIEQVYSKAIYKLKFLK